MKKILLFAFALLFSVGIFAQKSKKVEIFCPNNGGVSITAHINYNEDNKIKDTTILFLMRDARYTQLIEYITVCSGNYDEVIDFLQQVEKFAKENEPGMSTTIEGSSISYDKLMGGRNLFIYEKGKNGYCIISPKYLTKFKDKIIDWEKKNKK